MSFLNEIWIVSLELAPWLFFGAIVSALLHKWLPTNFIKTQLSGYTGIIKAVLLGVPLPLCSCGVIPAGMGLKKEGASDGSSIAFLISTPQTGVDSILVSAAFLGWPFALLKVVAATTTGIIGGVLTHISSDHRTPSEQTSPKEVAQPTWGDAWEHGVQLLRSIWGWLVVGIILSAALTSFVPKEVLTAAPDGIASLFVALLISLPLYVCATASVPIAAALVTGGLPLSAALVFLMAGPASNMATIGSIYKTFGTKTTAIYLGTIIVGSMAFAWGFDFLLLSDHVQSAHIHEHPLWKIPFAIALFVSFAYFAYEDFFKTNNGVHMNTDTPNRIFYVEGLHCSGCVSKLEKAVQNHDAVQSIHVTLETGEMNILGDISTEDLEAIVEPLGFQLFYSQLSWEVEGIHCGGCVAKLEKSLNSIRGVSHVNIQRTPDITTVLGKVSRKDIECAIISLGFTLKQAQHNGFGSSTNIHENH